jgi:hypothetical protein
LLLLLLPWSLYLPVALTHLELADRRRWQDLLVGQINHDPVPLFLLLWLVVVVGFFSAAATKLPGYILPAVPAGALLLALDWRPLVGPEPRGWPRRALAGWLEAALLALLAVAAALAPRWAATDPAHPGLEEALSRSGLPLLLALLLGLTALALVLLLRRGDGERWLWAPPLAGFLAILAFVVGPLAPLLEGRALPPTLLLHAGDDPWVPVGPLRQLAATAGGGATSGPEVLITPRGGHNGFHAPGDGPACWADRLVVAWLRRLSQVQGRG